MEVEKEDIIASTTPEASAEASAASGSAAKNQVVTNNPRINGSVATRQGGKHPAAVDLVEVGNSRANNSVIAEQRAKSATAEPVADETVRTDPGPRNPVAVNPVLSVIFSVNPAAGMATVFPAVPDPLPIGSAAKDRVAARPRVGTPAVKLATGYPTVADPMSINPAEKNPTEADPVAQVRAVLCLSHELCRSASTAAAADGERGVTECRGPQCKGETGVPIEGDRIAVSARDVTSAGFPALGFKIGAAVHVHGSDAAARVPKRPKVSVPSPAVSAETQNLTGGLAVGPIGPGLPAVGAAGVAASAPALAPAPAASAAAGDGGARGHEGGGGGGVVLPESSGVGAGGPSASFAEAFDVEGEWGKELERKRKASCISSRGSVSGAGGAGVEPVRLVVEDGVRGGGWAGGKPPLGNPKHLGRKAEKVELKALDDDTVDMRDSPKVSR